MLRRCLCIGRTTAVGTTFEHSMINALRLSGILRCKPSAKSRKRLDSISERCFARSRRPSKRMRNTVFNLAQEQFGPQTSSWESKETLGQFIRGAFFQDATADEDTARLSKYAQDGAREYGARKPMPVFHQFDPMKELSHLSPRD